MLDLAKIFVINYYLLDRGIINQITLVFRVGWQWI